MDNFTDKNRHVYQNVFDILMPYFIWKVVVVIRLRSFLNIINIDR